MYVLSFMKWTPHLRFTSMSNPVVTGLTHTVPTVQKFVMNKKWILENVFLGKKKSNTVP